MKEFCKDCDYENDRNYCSGQSRLEHIEKGCCGLAKIRGALVVYTTNDIFVKGESYKKGDIEKIIRAIETN